ncbi:MAG TPA: polysaccharide biosynthesis/export family protein, partial [Candidatus Polarisedimenticolia bacterium]|nr:polysaccharide biosynthesis/export family protein [Candidatus Polarisedimenticolia bacterium]
MFVALAVLSALGWVGSKQVMAAGEHPVAGPTVEALTFESTASGALLSVTTSVPVPRFLCSLDPGDARQIVLEFPEATSRLKAKYVFDTPLLRQATVDAGLNGGAGVRVRIDLGESAPASVEQIEHGVAIHLKTLAHTASSEVAAETMDYRIGVGDKLEIAVFGHDDLTKIVEVRGDGSINYPLIGDQVVAGKTVSQVDDEITKMLARDFLVDPEVSVDVREYKSQWVTIIGEVRSPGRYVLKQNMRLIDLLADAGGATKEAGVEILITRRQGGSASPKQIVIDRERLLSRENESANVILSHGDIVTIGEKEAFYIRGEVARPGSYFLENGMTILRAISVAGGL